MQTTFQILNLSTAWSWPSSQSPFHTALSCLQGSGHTGLLWTSDLTKYYLPQDLCTCCSFVWKDLSLHVHLTHSCHLVHFLQEAFLATLYKIVPNVTGFSCIPFIELITSWKFLIMFSCLMSFYPLERKIHVNRNLICCFNSFTSTAYNSVLLVSSQYIFVD